MKAFFLVLLSICASAALHAQVTWIADKPVGAGPSEVFTDSAAKRVHVLTSGIDADFDGLFEPESDVSAGWYVLDPSGNILDSTLFNGYFNSFPIRVGVDIAGRILYAPVNGKVGSFSLETLEPIDAALLDEAFAAVSYHPESGILTLSLRAPDFSSPGEIVYFHPELGLLARVEGGVNPGNGIGIARGDVGFGFYTVNEGGFGESNASLTGIGFNSNLFDYVNGESLGGGGADMLLDGDRAFLLMSGTHRVRIVDVNTHEEIAPSPIEVGTEGFDGPRCLAISGDTLYVGTYASDVRRFDLKTGEMIDAISLPGKVEDLAMIGSSLFAAISYTAGTYDADSLLVHIDTRSGEQIETIVVGAQPGSILANPSDGSVTALGYGAGDSPTPWWKTVDVATGAFRTQGTLSHSLSFPLRATLDPADGSILFVGSDTLFMLNTGVDAATPESLYTDPDASGDLFGVSDGSDYWLVTERPLDFAAAPCYVHAVRKSDRKRIAKFRTAGFYAIDAGIVPSSIPGGTAAYILHEGNFGNEDATLTLAEYVPHLFEGELGSGANHIMHGTDEYGSELTAVTMTGSHEVLFLDFNERGVPQITLRVPTGTTGLDGPRQSVIAPCVPVVFDRPLLVTTYSGEVLLLADERVVDTEEIGGKGEGIAALGDKVYTANSFETGTYTPGSTVSIITLIYSSVEDASTVSGATLDQNYPNPASDRTTIPFTLSRPGQVTLDLYTSTGELAGALLNTSLEAGRHEATIDTKGLPAGSYLFRLGVGGETFVKRMEVAR